MTDTHTLHHTPLHQWHKDHGAKMCPFAGYDMPIQYATGALTEHKAVREATGIFDVSHMGTFILEGTGIDDLLEHLTPADAKDCPVGKCRYTMLTNEKGGVIDDLIFTRFGQNRFLLILNAACKQTDTQHILAHTKENQTFTELHNTGLLALQGPFAREQLQKLVKDVNLADIKPMNGIERIDIAGHICTLTRTGYTGEDGYELIGLSPTATQDIWQKLIDNGVTPIGLAARDTLRLEAGFPLYGHDLTESTTPVEAGLTWTFRKRPLTCLGADVLINQQEVNPSLKRVGVQLLERGIAREGAAVLDSNQNPIGTLTSGGFGPTLNCGIGMAYVKSVAYTAGSEVLVDVRGRQLRAKLQKPSFLK